MFLKKAIPLLLALLLCIVSHAQHICASSVYGQIRDADGSPLVGAAILLTPGNVGQTTDAQGNYVFEALCPGTYSLEIQYIGYETETATLSLNGTQEKDFVLQEAVTELHEIVIQHHDAANTEHATNFTELGERKLSELAGKTLGETLTEIPGVTSLQTGPGIFKPVIHGVHSQRLLILNHGIRQEGQQWGAEHAPEIDPFIASNIVVIKDASAIKYGTDALGGVIVINPAPLPETNELGGSITSVLQSNGRAGTLSGMLEGGIKDHRGWGWRLQGTAKRTGDFSAPDYSLTNTGVNELNFSAASGYHTKKLGIDIFFSRFQSEIGILRGTAIGNLEDLVSAMERDVPLYTESFSYDIQEPRQEVSHNLLKVNGHVTGKSGEWRLQYGFQNNNRSEFDLRIGELSNIPAIDLRLNTHSIDTEWETHHSESRTFSFGVNTIYQTNKNIPGTQRIPFIPNFENISAGLFATSKFFFPKWTVDVGARYDYRNYAVEGFDFKNSLYTSSFDFNNLSAALGVTRNLAANHTVSLNVSTAWRPPHVSELYSVGTHQSAAAIEYGLMLDPATNEVRNVDDVQVLPEQALKAVGGYKIASDRIHLEINPFVNYIFNYIYLRPRGITRSIRGVYPYFRYDQTDALFTGADLNATVKVSEQLTAGSRISLLKARDVRNDSYFLFIPSSRYAIDLRYELPIQGSLKGAYLESKTQYVSRQIFSPRVVTVKEIYEGEMNEVNPFEGDPSIFDFADVPDGYFIWNVAGGFSIKTDKVQYDFRIAADNVLNQRYREYTNRFRYYADDLGRNLMLSVKCIF